MCKMEIAKNVIQRILAIMLVLVAMAIIVPAKNVSAAERYDGVYTDIDDSMVTTTGEVFKIQYEPSAKWHAESGYTDLFFDGTDHYSDAGAGDVYYEIKVIGYAFEIYGSKNVNHANCELFVDGEYAIDIPSGLESGPTQHKQQLTSVLWNSFTNGEHTLRVVRKAGDTRAIQIDKIRIYHSELSATKITLNAEKVKLGIGGFKKMEIAAIEPWPVTNPEIEWTSADESIAIVDENGLIMATSTSEERKETVVTATVKGTNVSASVKVVVDPLAEAMSVSIGDEKLLDTQLDYEKLLGADTKESWEGTAWRGDILNSKIVVLTKETDVHNLTVTASDFENEKGDVLSAENISIQWLKEILAREGRNMAGALNAYPDIIHKGGATDVPAESVKFAWISMEIPEDTKPGVYKGIITVKANGLKKPIEFTYTIEVIDLVQPAPEVTDVQIWQHPFSVANYYLGLGAKQPGGICNELDEDFYFTEEHFNLMREATLDYVSMGGHDWVANIVEEAWNHQSYYNDLSMVKWTKKTDGTWEFDYTWYDAWVEFGIECGVIDPETELGQIKCYSIVPWNNQVTYYDEASGKTVKESHTPGEQAWRALWVPFLEDFMEHSKEKGWFDITYISMDERTIAQLQPTVDLIEGITDEKGESFRISSALNYAAPEYYDFTDRIHDISINLGHCTNKEQMNELAEHRRALGLKTTMYTCTGNYPGNFTISDPGDNYWQIWYTMTLGMDGFMRWAWDNYVYDMHGNVTYRYWEPGDGWYIYPVEREKVGEDYDAGFYSTPRYELFKQGIRDVAKAKYLMEQSEVIAQEIDKLVETLAHPSQGSNNGSAVAGSEAQRLSLHMETDRVYDEVTAWAKAYIADPENPELPKDPNKKDPADDSKDYPVEKLTATAGSEQADASSGGEGLAEFVLDGDTSTYHHSAWRPQASEDQLWIMLELEEPAKIEALRYLPRPGRDNGTVLEYEISYSMDGENWGNIAAGVWPLNKEWKLARFDEAVEAKYIKLYAVDSVADAVGRHLSAAEIRLVVASEETDPPVDPPVEDIAEVVRLFGAGRYETGYAVANELKEVLCVDKFEAVVVATGKNFADALAGSYLAVEKNAPILLTNGKDDNVAQLHAYIAANVVEGGTVYILGGDGAVPTSVDAIEGYEVERLFGDSRYDTNLAILKEAGVSGNSIIVATGKTFADSLSASAAKLPILLVKPDGTLNDAQKEILTGMKNIYIVGGDGAVSASYEAELKAFGEVTRVFGDSRYDTSVEVAKTFCGNVDTAVVASGKNFPDGLCGGPLAAAINAPLVLTKDGGAGAAGTYVAENGILGGYVLGGDGALADQTVVDVFALESADEIKTGNDETAEDSFIGIFWYTFADQYLTSVRNVLDAELTGIGLEAGKNFVNYDAAREQATQMEQIDAAIEKGATCLAVNIVKAGSPDVAQQIVDKASAAGIPVVFFNRLIGIDGNEKTVLEGYDKCAFVGADFTEAGHLQGQMIGEYLVDNYHAVDLNGDGKISYAMFMGQLGNAEAAARTQYGVEDANAVLKKAGKPEIVYFDSANTNCYQADKDGHWSSDAVYAYMQTNLSRYNEENGNMIELVICNNDGMAEGAILALQNAGYNKEGASVIPVFGIDGTDTAKALIEQGLMSGTVEHDAEGLANCIAHLAGNVNAGGNLMDETEDYNFAEGFTNKIFIPYVAYTGE